MRVIKIYIFFQIVFIGNIFSQAMEDFNLKLPDHKIPFSNYNILNVIDQRSDTTNVGFVYGNVLKNTILLQPQTPLSGRLEYIIQNFSDSSLNGELLLQIRKMKFVQRSSDKNDEGLFFFRANLYEKGKNNFQKLASIDTLLIVPNSDETKKLKDEGSDMISNFLLKNISKLPLPEENLSYMEILKMDSIEKSKIKAYSVGDYIDGIYLTFESFKKQIPDYTNIRIKYRGSSVKKVGVINSNNIKINVEAKDIFAVIHKGKIFVSAEFGYYNLYKFNGDFYFIGEGEMPHNLAEILLAEGAFKSTGSIVAFGGVGAIINATTPKKVYFEIKVDHIDGTFMRCKRVYNY